MIATDGALESLTDAQLRDWMVLARAEYQQADPTEDDLKAADEVFGACLNEMLRRETSSCARAAGA